ncbi:hypothetical protein CLI64_19080 [Nostoc sp. CENA543]|uniref:hypothetical protein n=1 Tax=Nostoc sp. CENA543 TaxID=1869241 RepID=UPI000CA1DA60|nr:hypothetical protein [Nostoc sp. CENA543]AUT04420.1 hypothetical protein CLI64_19080 [Nostoc sp. CENA543]
MKKTTLLTLTFSTLLILPAMAQLGKVWTDFQYYSTDFQNYLRNNLNDSLDNNSQNALSNARGDLNLPNPIDAGKQARQGILFFNTIPDKFENNQAVYSNSVTNEINRVITRSSVVGVLGRDAQIRTKNKLENTEQTIENITNISNESDNLFNQIIGMIPGGTSAEIAAKGQSNLQYQSIRIQSEQSKLIAETLAQNLQTNQFIQYSNLNLANISQQIEESNRARRIDSATEAARLLRTTSQIDLFGTKTDN